MTDKRENQKEKVTGPEIKKFIIPDLIIEDILTEETIATDIENLSKSSSSDVEDINVNELNLTTLKPTKLIRLEAFAKYEKRRELLRKNSNTSQLMSNK